MAKNRIRYSALWKVSFGIISVIFLYLIFCVPAVAAEEDSPGGGATEPVYSQRLGPENALIIEEGTPPGPLDYTGGSPDGTIYVPVFTGSAEAGDKRLNRFQAIRPDGSVKWDIDLKLDPVGVSLSPRYENDAYISAQRMVFHDMPAPVVAADGTVFVVDEYAITQKETRTPRFQKCPPIPSFPWTSDYYAGPGPIHLDGSALWKLMNCRWVTGEPYTIETTPATYNRVTAIDPDGYIKWQWAKRYENASYFAAPGITADGALNLGIAKLREKCPTRIRLPEWSVAADRCAENSDGTYTLSGNVILNDYLYYSASVVVDKINQELIASGGQLYMLTSELEDDYASAAGLAAAQAAKPGNKRPLADNFKVAGRNIVAYVNGREVPLNGKIMIGGYPFSLTSIKKNSSGDGVIVSLKTKILSETIEVPSVEITKDEGVKEFHLVFEQNHKLLFSKYFSFDQARLDYTNVDGKKKLSLQGIVSMSNKKWPIQNIDGSVSFANGKLDEFGMKALFGGLGVPIPNTLAYLKELGVNVNNLTADPSSPITYTGDFTINGGAFFIRQVKIISADHIRVVMDTKPSVVLTGNMKLFEYDLSKTTARWDARKGFDIDSELSILNFIEGNTNFHFANDGFKGKVEGQVTLPDKVSAFLARLPYKGLAGMELPGASGTIDQKGIKGKVSLPVGPPLSFAYDFSQNSWSFPRAQELPMDGGGWNENSGNQKWGTNLTPIPVTSAVYGYGGAAGGLASAQEVEPHAVVIGQPYKEIVIGVSWDSGDGEVTLVTPDNRRIKATAEKQQQENIEAIRMGTLALFSIVSPVQGTYTIEYDAAKLTGVTIEPYSVNSPPSLSFTDNRYDPAAQSVTLRWTSQDEDDTAGITFYYANEPNGNGIPFATGATDSPVGSYVWEVAGLPTGTYWIYAELDDLRNAPVRVDAAAPIRHVRADAPPPPSGLAAAARNGGIDLRWVNAPGITDYLITIADSSTGEEIKGFRADDSGMLFIPKESIQPGDYTVNMESVALIGEEEVYGAPASVTVTVLPANPPALDRLLWSNRTGRSSLPTLTLSGSLAAGVTATVSQDEVPVATVSGSVYSTFTLTPGINMFRVHAADESGNEAEMEYTIFYDNMPPVILVQSMTKETAAPDAPVIRLQGITEPGAVVAAGSQTVTAGDDGGFTVTFPFTGIGMDMTLSAVGRTGLQSSKTVRYNRLIADAGLELAIRQMLSKSGDEITAADLEGMEQLEAWGQDIQDLSGLEHAVNLKKLIINDNAIRDLSAFRSLTKLQELNLSGNQITGISDLAGLTQLTRLSLARNRIESIEPLRGLALLKTLDLSGNRINEISALGDLPALNEVHLYTNPGLNFAEGSPASLILKALEDRQVKVIILSNNTDLAKLEISSGLLTPYFMYDTKDYNVNVEHSVESITVTPTAADSSAVIRVNGIPTASGAESKPVSLHVGINTIVALVSAEDGDTQKAYTIRVNRAASVTAELAVLSLSAGALSPGFSPGITEYTAYAGELDSITVSASAMDGAASVSINGEPAASGQGGVAIALQPGVNPVELVVTGPDGTVKRYHVRVFRSAPWKEITGGFLGALAVQDDGTVWDVYAAGSEFYKSPVTGLTDIIHVSSSSQSEFSIALKGDGTVWTWGDNGYGQLGDGTTNSRTTPAMVPGLTDIIAVSAGHTHAVALQRNGTVWTWGDNARGQLGDGTVTGRLSPAAVSGLTGVKAVAAGRTSSHALKEDGTVWAWGGNNAGQLGDGTYEDKRAPVQSNGVAGVASLVMKDNTVFALKADGTLWAWGEILSDLSGGYSVISYQRDPSQVNGIDGVTAASIGSSYYLAVRNDGSLWSWGKNENGQLGDGTTTPRIHPAQVALQPVAAVTTGNLSGMMSIAVKTDGSIWAWGGYDNGGASPVEVKLPVAANTNADLSGIAITSGTLSPAFSPDVASYSAMVSHEVSAITVTPTAQSKTSAISVNGIMVRSEQSVGPIGLAEGSNWITMVVTAESGAVKTYVLNVVRRSASTTAGFHSVLGADYHTIALKEDGAVWTWGYNGYGLLADGTTEGRPTPIPAEGLDDVVAIERGSSHNTVLKADGTVWSWGNNEYGQLGDGTTASSMTPVRVNGLSGVVAIAGRMDFTLALKADGTVWGWGFNEDGELGNGSAVSQPAPVRVQGLSGVKAIAAGAYHAVAIKEDGTVWTWGYNEVGQLGDGTVNSRSTPVQVVGVGRMKDVSAGYFFTVALGEDGTVYTWGYNIDGQLGDGTTKFSLYPLQVSGLEQISAISAGGFHVMTLKEDGTVWTWGANNLGQLGDGTTEYRYHPVQVQGLGGVYRIGGGMLHSLASKPDGTVWGWGNNGDGQLGDGTRVSRKLPVRAVGLEINQANLTGITLSSGRLEPVFTPNQTTYSVRIDPRVNTLGVAPAAENPAAVVSVMGEIIGNGAGSGATVPLADGSTLIPITVTEPGGSSKTYTLHVLRVNGTGAVSGGGYHTLGVKADGTLWTWGGNDSGQVGDDTYGDQPKPVKVMDRVVEAASGRKHTAAITEDGSVWTWGYNDYGQLGSGMTYYDESLPKKVKGIGGAAAVAAGDAFTAVLKTDGTVWVWGGNRDGQLGDGTTIGWGTPQRVDGLEGVKAIAAGAYHLLALKADGSVWAWGGNDYGQLGDGSRSDRTHPVKVMDGGKAIAAGSLHSVVVKEDATLWTWGFNQKGQLGSGTMADQTLPAKVLDGVKAAAAGKWHTLALKLDGTVWAWGYNEDGELGDGTTLSRAGPVQTQGLNGVVSVAAGRYHSIAVQADGSVWTWGYNADGELGDGTTENRLVPTEVKEFEPVSAETGTDGNGDGIVDTFDAARAAKKNLRSIRDILQDYGKRMP